LLRVCEHDYSRKIVLSIKILTNLFVDFRNLKRLSTNGVSFLRILWRNGISDRKDHDCKARMEVR
jgi:hypothetical protein